jgi:hypothetical protein
MSDPLRIVAEKGNLICLSGIKFAAAPIAAAIAAIM